MTTALILCGALAREVIDIARRRAWDVQLFGVAAPLHMRPQGIAPAVERRLRELLPRFGRAVVVYGECGTRGALDQVLAHYNVPRVDGPHCYEMYAGPAFDQFVEQEPGTFFLTDFLVRGFHGTLRKGLGLDRFPELRDAYFGNYQRIIYLVQREDPALVTRAKEIALELGLPLELRRTGYGLLEERLANLMEQIGEERYTPVNPPVSLFGETPPHRAGTRRTRGED